MRWLTLLLVFALAGCAAPTITLETLEPASAQGVTQLRRLAVIPLRNDAGGVATAALEHALASTVVGQKPYFTMVDARIKPSYLEGRGVEMVFSPSEIGRYGRDAGADGVVFGTVSRADYRDERIMQQRSVCVEENERGDCKKYGMRKVRCTRRTGTFAFTPKVVNVATGGIVVTQEFSEDEESVACSRAEDDRLASGSDLVAAARQRAIARFVELVAPHVVRLRLPLLAEDDSGMSEAVKARIEGGIDFAREGRMDKACSLWDEASRMHEAGYALPYLRGVCAEHSGDLARAKALYVLADRRATKPVPELSEALARIQKSIADRAVLETQLR